MAQIKTKYLKTNNITLFIIIYYCIFFLNITVSELLPFIVVIYILQLFNLLKLDYTQISPHTTNCNRKAFILPHSDIAHRTTPNDDDDDDDNPPFQVLSEHAHTVRRVHNIRRYSGENVTSHSDRPSRRFCRPCVSSSSSLRRTSSCASCRCPCRRPTLTHTSRPSSDGGSPLAGMRLCACTGAHSHHYVAWRRRRATQAAAAEAHACWLGRVVSGALLRSTHAHTRVVV